MVMNSTRSEGRERKRRTSCAQPHRPCVVEASAQVGPQVELLVLQAATEHVATHRQRGPVANIQAALQFNRNAK